MDNKCIVDTTLGGRKLKYQSVEITGRNKRTTTKRLLTKTGKTAGRKNMSIKATRATGSRVLLANRSSHSHKYRWSKRRYDEVHSQLREDEFIMNPFGACACSSLMIRCDFQTPYDHSRKRSFVTSGEGPTRSSQPTV